MNKSIIVTLIAAVALVSGLALTSHPSGLAHYRSGSQAVTLLILTTNVVFSTPMTGTNYALSLSPSSAASVSYTLKSAAGFTMVSSVGLNGYVDWLAIESQ